MYEPRRQARVSAGTLIPDPKNPEPRTQIPDPKKAAADYRRFFDGTNSPAYCLCLVTTLSMKTTYYPTPQEQFARDMSLLGEVLGNWRIAFVVIALLAGVASARALDSSAAATDGATSVSTVPEINHMVYLSFLPETAELMTDAKRNGLTVLRLDKTADKVIVTYKYPDGHTATLGYGLISAAGQAERVAELNREPERTVVVTREPEIIYVDRTPYRSRVVYRDPVDDFWLPLTVGFGLGWISTSHHHGGYYHGGYRGSYHGRPSYGGRRH